MAQVVLLNDFTEHPDTVKYSRYLGPYILASKARNAGFDCVVVEGFTKFDNLFEVLDKVIDSSTLFVGISGTFLGINSESINVNQSNHPYSAGFLWLSHLQEIQDFLHRLKSLILSKNSKAPVVLGGTKALFFLQTPEKRALFDFYVIGKAESFFTQMLTQLKNNETLPWRAYEGAKYIVTDCYGVPAVEEVSAIRWEATDIIQQGEALPLEIAKGCLYNCKFCNFDKQSAVKKDLQLLKDEITRNFEKFGTTVYSFCDDCFNDTRGKVESFCNMFLSLPFKIEWISYVRVDVAVRFPHTLDLMVESGARGLFWGIESLNHAVAKSAGKGTDPELVKQMLLRLKSTYGDQVISQGSFIIGLPGESEESLQQTLDWLISSRALDMINVNPLFLRPYSERLDKAVIDYADYSRNPTKYGFQEISFEGKEYWAHSEMNFPRAIELRTQWRETLKQNGYDFSVMPIIFQYPHLRSLGFSHSEIRRMMKTAHWKNQDHQEILSRQKKWNLNYQRQFISTISKPEYCERAESNLS